MNKEILDQLILMNDKLDKLIGLGQKNNIGGLTGLSAGMAPGQGSIKSAVEQKIAEAKRESERRFEEARRKADQSLAALA